MLVWQSTQLGRMVTDIAGKRRSNTDIADFAVGRLRHLFAGSLAFKDAAKPALPVKQLKSGHLYGGRFG